MALIFTNKISEYIESFLQNVIASTQLILQTRKRHSVLNSFKKPSNLKVHPINMLWSTASSFCKVLREVSNSESFFVLDNLKNWNESILTHNQGFEANIIWNTFLIIFTNWLEEVSNRKYTVEDQNCYRNNLIEVCIHSLINMWITGIPKHHLWHSKNILTMTI